MLLNIFIQIVKMFNSPASSNSSLISHFRFSENVCQSKQKSKKWAQNHARLYIIHYSLLMLEQIFHFAAASCFAANVCDDLLQNDIKIANGQSSASI